MLPCPACSLKPSNAWFAAERLLGERAVRGGLVRHDGGILLRVPQARGHLEAEAAALHHEPQQVQVMAVVPAVPVVPVACHRVAGG